jgi:tripartite ATP-independent transporter DctM subunit
VPQSPEPAVPHAAPGSPVNPPSKFPPFRVFARIEDAILVLALAVMVVLPLGEAALRTWFHFSIPQAATIVQHLVLVVALVGGAIATREHRLLALSTLTESLHGAWKIVSNVFSAATGAAIAVGLAWAGYKLLEVQEGLSILGLPVERLLWLMPAAFVLIALRLIWRAGDPASRATAFLIAGLLVTAAIFVPMENPVALTIALVLLFAATLAGLPIFTVLGGAALILFLSKQEPLAAIAISQYDMAVNPTLPAVPLFTLAGYFLAEGGASKRLVRVFHALFGHFRGGAGVMTILVCTFFTSFTGASGVTILALGGLLMPVLREAHYSERQSLGIITGAGSLGMLLPPCLPLILYAIVASHASAPAGFVVGINEMFAAGILPGILLAALAAALVIFQQPRSARATRKFSLSEAASAIREAKWELILPLIALGAILGGFATPVEASALTALYAFIVETFVYRDLTLRKAARVLVEAGLLIGGILLILGVAMGLTNYLVDAQIPDLAVDWTKQSIAKPWVFLLALNLLLLIVGCLMDIYSAIVIVVPIIVPVAMAFNVNLVHLGIIFLANLELGYLTPPVGMNLFMTSYRFKKPMPEVVRSVLPMLAVFSIGVLLITYIPALSTALPELLGLSKR